MTWFKKLFAQDYGDGSSGDDFLDVQDGSETNQNWLNTTELSNGEGQGNVPDFGELNHPTTPDGESATQNSDYTNQGRYEHDTDDSARYTTMPFSEDGVDDNHANGLGVSMASNSMMRLFVKAGKCLTCLNVPDEGRKLCDTCTQNMPTYVDPKKLSQIRQNVNASQGQEADFFTSHVTGGPADSPQILNDGHADEELQRDTEGVKSTTNNFDTSTKTDNSVFQDPGIVREDNDDQDIPEINKGRVANLNQIWAQFNNSKFDAVDEPIYSLNRYLLENECNDLMKKSEYSWGDNSNVQQYYDPDEVRNDKIKKGKDYGTGDVSSNDNQANAPLDDGTNPDMKNYSGIDPTASMLDIIMRKADYGGVMPSVNPNSGRDDDDDEYEIRPAMGDGQQIDVMDTGKQEFNTTQNMDDKEFNDPSYYRQRRIKYDNTNRAGDDTEDYFNLSGSGQGGMGMEGDGQNFSGVNNA